MFLPGIQNFTMPRCCHFYVVKCLLFVYIVYVYDIYIYIYIYIYNIYNIYTICGLLWLNLGVGGEHLTSQLPIAAA